jgi:hypothetical protein
VRVGGDADKIETTTFKVGSDSPYKDPTRLVGDATGDSYVNMADASAIISDFTGAKSLSGDDKQAADATDDGFVNMADASSVISYFTGGSDVLGTKTLADKENLVDVATE